MNTLGAESLFRKRYTFSNHSIDRVMKLRFESKRFFSYCGQRGGSVFSSIYVSSRTILDRLDEK